MSSTISTLQIYIIIRRHCARGVLILASLNRLSSCTNNSEILAREYYPEIDFTVLSFQAANRENYINKCCFFNFNRFWLASNEVYLYVVLATNLYLYSVES